MGYVNSNVEVYSSPEMERLRGKFFELRRFDEQFYSDDHAHCQICDKKIAEAYLAADFTEGYVTEFERYQLPDRFGLALRWLCSECFNKYAVQLGLRENKWLTELISELDLNNRSPRRRN